MQSLADDKLDPATARAVQAARERMDSLTKNRDSVDSSDLEGRTKVVVSAPFGAGDLSIVDRTYALVASGVGWLDASLQPGEYSVRHQIGEESAIESISVLKGTDQKVELPPLPFASPIPLFGTRFFRDGSDLKTLSEAGGNFRLLLWVPAADFAVRTPGPNSKRIESELNRLRLEVFDVNDPSIRQTVQLPEPIWTAQGSALLAITLDVGCYVLVQTDGTGRRSCMPVWVHPGMLTCLFLLSLDMDGMLIPVDLNHASVSFLLADGQRGNRWIDSLYQLEAARKALTLGRQVKGWAGESINAADYTKENPLLHLMDALFLFSSVGASSDAPFAYGSCAAERFETSFPDSQAVLVSITRLKRAELAPSQEEFKFAGPPLLRRSWEVLLRAPEGNVALSKVMSFPFVADGNGAWFVWSEDPVGPQLRTAPPTNTSDIQPPDSVARASGMRLGGENTLSAILLAGVNLIGGLFAKRQATKDEMLLERADPVLKSEIPALQNPISDPGAPLVTFDDVVGLLVALTENGIIQKYLNSGRKYAASKGVAIDDEVLHRLVQSLSVLRNKTLVKALTAEVLVREALLSLGLPKEKVIQLVRAALTDLMVELSEEDLGFAKQVMHPILGSVERWFWQT